VQKEICHHKSDNNKFKQQLKARTQCPSWRIQNHLESPSSSKCHMS